MPSAPTPEQKRDVLRQMQERLHRASQPKHTNESLPSLERGLLNPETGKVETREETLARWAAEAPEQERLYQEREKELGDDCMD